MNHLMRSTISLVLGVLIILTATICVRQRYQINHLLAEQDELAAKYTELSAKYKQLSTADFEKIGEISRLRKTAYEVIRLRNDLSHSKPEPRATATVRTTNLVVKTETSPQTVEYLTKQPAEFVGFDSPENTFQSLRWAVVNGDYETWVASLSPQLQDEEIANPNSMKAFQAAQLSESQIKGVQMLSKRELGNGRVELKMRMDREGSISVMVFPMLAVENEWRLGADVRNAETHAYWE